ncbi:DUF3899 domain-containing protein [Salimicrobium humidisoli]|uniref:DUF3899 domain-containing protein n=1 Tax=Salimicrobium humidisoli TaxID=2029857 RepID=A0ABX4HSE8_9BACI|nr:DUF3899 domain-containing protein [Salimicrobium humidisoli]PBB06119.1 hypothetical protein CKW00_05030 [Salimicrobium humidisoli]
MEAVKKPFFVLLVNFVITALLFLFNSPEYTLKYYINSVFYVVFFYLFIALIMWVIRGRFFDGIAYSFRRFYNKTSKQRAYLEEWKGKPLPSETVNRSWLRMFFFQGVIMLMVMFVLLFFYYAGVAN